MATFGERRAMPSVLSFRAISPVTFAYLLLGAYSIVTQILLIREFLVIFFGNELCMGIFFAAWLVSIFSGAALGGRLIARTRHVLAAFVLLQYAVLLLPFAQIALIRNVRFFLDIPPGLYVPFFPVVLSMLVILFPFGFCIGFIFPFASRIAPRSSDLPAKAIGSVYIWESLGSSVGGAAATFYLIHHYSPYQIASILAFIMLAHSLLLIRRLEERHWRSIMLGVWMSVVFLGLGLTGFHSWSWIEKKTIKQRWESINPGIEFIESLNSPYQNIAIGRIVDQYSIYGNGQHVASFPDPFQSAVRAHFILSQHPHPGSVLLIGGGSSGVLSEMLKHPVQNLDYLELDPTFFSAVRRYLPAETSKAYSDHRVHVHLQDGRYYIKRCKKKYDVVVIDLPDPSTALLNRFFTLDFYTEIAEILKPGGLVVTGVTSSENYIGPEIGNYTASVFHTIASVFPHVLVTPGDYNYFFASTSAGVATADVKLLAERYAERHINTPYFSPYHFQILLPPERVAFINRTLKQYKPPHLNTDTRPSTYYYNLVLWNIFSGSREKALVGTMAGWSWKVFFLPLLALLFARLLYLASQKGRSAHHEIRFNSLFALFATGFAAMGLEIILVFAYQNMFGYLYQRIGLIVALFMAGLALGAQLMSRYLHRLSPRGHTCLLTIQVAITAYSLLLPLMLNLLFRVQDWGGASLSELLFMVLVLFSGGLTGVEFPLINEILIRHGVSPGKASGLADAYDHLGASLGAALIGTAFIPLLGTTQAALFIASLNFMACLFLIHFLRREAGEGHNL